MLPNPSDAPQRSHKDTKNGPKAKQKTLSPSKEQLGGAPKGSTSRSLATKITVRPPTVSHKTTHGPLPSPLKVPQKSPQEHPKSSKESQKIFKAPQPPANWPTRHPTRQPPCYSTNKHHQATQPKSHLATSVPSPSSPAAQPPSRPVTQPSSNPATHPHARAATKSRRGVGGYSEAQTISSKCSSKPYLGTLLSLS